MLLSRRILRGAFLVMIVQMAACSTYTQPDREPASVEKPPERTVVKPPPRVHETPPRAATHSASAAWKPLLAKAELATDRGDYEQALALLERAQRIDPDSARVYLGFAQTHQAKGDTAQARATAERGLLYCSSHAVCDALRAYTR